MQSKQGYHKYGIIPQHTLWATSSVCTTRIRLGKWLKRFTAKLVFTHHNTTSTSANCDMSAYTHNKGTIWEKFYNMNTITNVMSWRHCIVCEILSSFLSTKAARWSVRRKAWVLVSQARLSHRKRVWSNWHMASNRKSVWSNWGMAIGIADQQQSS